MTIEVPARRSPELHGLVVARGAEIAADRLRLRPWTVKQGIPFVARVHRHLPKVQGAMWCISVRRGDEVVGVALVGHASRLLAEDDATLCVIRVAVIEGVPNACSMLYGACSKMARACGSDNLVTYTLPDESGISLIAAGWISDGLTEGGEHDRPSRRRKPAIDPRPKRRWWAPWSKSVARRSHV